MLSFVFQKFTGVTSCGLPLCPHSLDLGGSGGRTHSTNPRGSTAAPVDTSTKITSNFGQQTNTRRIRDYIAAKIHPPDSAIYVRRSCALCTQLRRTSSTSIKHNVLVDEVQTGRSGNGGDETREFPSRSSPPAFESSREFRLSTVMMAPLAAARAAAGFSRVPLSLIHI